MHRIRLWLQSKVSQLKVLISIAAVRLTQHSLRYYSGNRVALKLLKQIVWERLR